MARTQITLQDQKVHSMAEAVLVSADSANGMFFKNNGFCKVLIKTGAGGTGNVTIKSVTDSNRRVGDIVVAMGANKVYESSFFELNLFNSGGNVDIDIDDDTDMEIAVLRQAV